MLRIENLKIFICALMLPVLFISAGCETRKPEKPEIVTEKIAAGIVNVNELMKCHKDWKNLDRYDKKLEDIKKRIEETASGKSLRELGEDQAKRMREAHKKAQAELQAELKSVEKSLDQQKQSTQAQFKKAVDEARANAGRLSGSAPSKHAAELTGDMVMLRDRQISSRRLALQKKASENVHREKDRLDRELAEYEQQISKENQQQRLNIQLKMQIEGSEEDKKVLQDELAAINEDEAKLKNAKKAAIASELQTLSDREYAAVEKEIAIYQQELNRDILKQVGGAPAASDAAVQAERIERDLAAKQKSLENEMAAAGEKANSRLNAKKAEIEKRLAELEKSLKNEMMQSQQVLMEADMAKAGQLKSEYDSVEKDRKSLYDAMLADIEKTVLAIASEKGVNVVFMSYVANVSAVDLTDSVKAALEKELK